MGYSMGAQMSLLLASLEPDVSTVLAMVPPYVDNPTSPVAPRVHINQISQARVLWLAGRTDPYSSAQQTQQAFDNIKSINKQLVWFDSGHRLPPVFLQTVFTFLDSLQEGDAL